MFWESHIDYKWANVLVEVEYDVFREERFDGRVIATITKIAVEKSGNREEPKILSQVLRPFPFRRHKNLFYEKLEWVEGQNVDEIRLESIRGPNKLGPITTIVPVFTKIVPYAKSEDADVRYVVFLFVSLLTFCFSSS